MFWNRSLKKKPSKPLYFCSLKQCILLYLPSFADCFNFPFGKIDLGWKLRQNVIIRWWQYKTEPKMCQKSILRYQPRHFGFHSCRLATKSHHFCRRPWCFIDMLWLYTEDLFGSQNYKHGQFISSYRNAITRKWNKAVFVLRFRVAKMKL